MTYEIITEADTSNRSKQRSIWIGEATDQVEAEWLARMAHDSKMRFWGAISVWVVAVPLVTA